MVEKAKRLYLFESTKVYCRQNMKLRILHAGLRWQMSLV